MARCENSGPKVRVRERGALTLQYFAPKCSHLTRRLRLAVQLSVNVCECLCHFGVHSRCVWRSVISLLGCLWRLPFSLFAGALLEPAGSPRLCLGKMHLPKCVPNVIAHNPHVIAHNPHVGGMQPCGACFLVVGCRGVRIPRSCTPEDERRTVY